MLKVVQRRDVFIIEFVHVIKLAKAEFLGCTSIHIHILKLQLLMIAKIHIGKYFSSQNNHSQKAKKIMNGCLKFHPGKFMCHKLRSAMYMAIAFLASTHF
jgi:hypothetical protein